MPSPKQELKPTNFVVIRCEAHISRPIAETWFHIGDFSNAGRFLDVQSALVTDVEGIGSVRIIADSILEVMVGQTQYSYTYAQILGPMAHLNYHGCVLLAEASAESCDLTYFITYDQTQMEELTRQDQVDRIRRRFTGAVAVMKKDAESLRP